MCFGDERFGTTQRRAHGCTQAFAKANRHAVKTLCNALGFVVRGCAQGACLRHRCIEKSCAIQVARQSFLQCKRAELVQISLGQHFAAPCIFQSHEFGDGKVGVVGFDGGLNVGQGQAAIGLLRERLRLNAAKHGCAATLPTITVGHLTHNKFIAALAIGQQATQIALRARGHEQGRLKAQHLGNFVLKFIHAGIVTEHVVAHQSLRHGFTHARCWTRNGIAAQIDT